MLPSVFHQLLQAAALGPGVASQVQLGVDLVDVLLHRSLGQEQLPGDLPVAEPPGHPLGHGPFPLCQSGEGLRPLPDDLHRLAPGLEALPSSSTPALLAKKSGRSSTSGSTSRRYR